MYQSNDEGILMNEGFDPTRPEPTIRIRVFSAESRRSHLFVNEEVHGTRCYAEFRSFAAIPDATRERAVWTEVRMDVVPNGYNLGVHTNQEEITDQANLVETIITGSYVVVSGSNLEMVQFALGSYLRGLGEYLAGQERMAAALAVRAHQ